MLKFPNISKICITFRPSKEQIEWSKKLRIKAQLSMNGKT